jgi:hypothetical protein
MAGLQGFGVETVGLVVADHQPFLQQNPEMSGTAVVGGIRKGSRDNATNPRPKPASPNTKLASARMLAPATHARLTRRPSTTQPKLAGV